MWRKRRSALFIDFENVRMRSSPEMIAALIAWLEDGKFDQAGGKRKLVQKRIYWNSSAEKHRDAFEAAGFEVVLCEKFSTMKNRSGPQAGTWSAGRCCSHTCRAATPKPPSAKAAARPPIVALGHGPKTTPIVECRTAGCRSKLELDDFAMIAGRRTYAVRGTRRDPSDTTCRIGCQPSNPVPLRLEPRMVD